MCMTDPLADMLTRIRNGQAAGKLSVNMPTSKIKVSLCGLLKKEGYIEDFKVEGEGSDTILKIRLKYFDGSPVIENSQRISKPGRRVYKKAKELPSVLGGMGIAVISTSRGLMTDQMARTEGFGGEVLCYIS